MLLKTGVSACLTFKVRCTLTGDCIAVALRFVSVWLLPLLLPVLLLLLLCCPFLVSPCRLFFVRVSVFKGADDNYSPQT